MCSVALLEVLDDTKGVQVVVEAQAVFAHGRIERPLARMAEWRMADIVDEGEGLAKIFIKVERLRHCAGDLRDLESMGEPTSEVVRGAVGKNLGLPGHAPERSGVGHASAIALEGAAIGVNVFRVGTGGEWVLTVASVYRGGGEIQLASTQDLSRRGSRL